MNDEDHSNRLGRLQSNLHSFELLLRFHLAHIESNGKALFPPGVNHPHELPIGARLPVNRFTDFASLRQLIARYDQTRPQELPPIDGSILALRDSLAHGRVYASAGPGFPLVLVRFSKPEDGFVVVVENARLTEDWFTAKTTLIFNAIKEVNHAHGVMKARLG